MNAKPIKQVFLLVASIVLMWVFLTADANVRASVFGVLASLIVAVLAHHHASMRAVKASHFPKKADAYLLLFHIFFDLLLEAKGSKTIDQRKLLNRMMEFKKQLLIWGSFETMQAMKNIENASEVSDLSTEQMLLNLEHLLRAAREDLGHDDSSIPNGDLISLIVIQT